MAIDLSSGLVPKSDNAVDLSAGLVPDPMAGSPTAIANRALQTASPGRGMQVSGTEQNPRKLAVTTPVNYTGNSPLVAGALGAAVDTGDAMRKQAEEDAKPTVQNLVVKPLLGPLPAAASLLTTPKRAGEHIANAINAYHANEPVTATQEGLEGAGDAAQALSAAKIASPLIDTAQSAARSGTASFLRNRAVGSMNAIIKPPNSAFEFGREPGAAALDEGAWGLTRKGIFQDVSQALTKRTEQLQQTVNQASGMIDLRPAIHDVLDPKIDFLTKHGETTQAEALKSIRDNYLDPAQWPKMGNMTPAEATKFKRDVGDMVHWSGDPLEATKADVRRNLYGATKQRINEQVPQVAELNNRVASLLSAQKSLKTQVNRDAVAAPVNMMDIATDLAAGPGVAFARKVLMAPGPRSIFAQGMNKAADFIRPAEAPVAAAPSPILTRGRFLPAGSYEAPPAPVAGRLPENASAGMQSIPTEIEGRPHIPFLRRPAGLPPAVFQAPPPPVRGLLPAEASTARQSVPTEIEGVPHIPSFIRGRLPAGQYEMPPSPLPPPPLINSGQASPTEETTKPLIQSPPRAPTVSTAKKTVALNPGEAVTGSYGSDVRVKTASRDIPARYKLVEADSLTPSHNAETFAKNANYPEGVQERAYHTSKEAQNRVIQQAQNYDPAYTVNTNPDAVNGPPVVTKDGVVLGGNSRTMSTQRLYSRNGGEAYRGAIKSQAQQFGIDPKAVDKLQKPVLVREVSSPKTVDEARQLGTDLNKSMTGALGTSEKAVSAGRAIKPETVQSIAGMIDDMGGDASIRDVLRDRGKDILGMLVQDGAITERERPQFIDTGSGGLSEEGKTFVESALRGHVIDDPVLMDRVPKNVLSKLDGSLSDIVGVAQRTDEYNLLPILREALAEHADIASRGSDVETHLAQTGMFGPERNPAVDAIVRKLGDKPKEVKTALRQFTQDANFDKQGQSALLTVGEQPSPTNAFNAAFGTNFTEDEFQQSLIDAIEKQEHNRTGATNVSGTQGQAQKVADDLQQHTAAPAQGSHPAGGQETPITLPGPGVKKRRFPPTK